jgi:surfeit locus 1 family protein
LRERRAANALAAQARAAPPVELTVDQLDSALAGRRVRVRGRYDHTHEIVVRGREYGGVPGVEMVTPLVMDDGKTAVLVDRGFVPTPDAVTVIADSFREPGRKEVQGYLVPVPDGRGMPVEHGGLTTWRRLDLGALRARLPYQLYPFAILQAPDNSLPRFPRRQDPPPIDNGPHLYYAIQWFSFSVIALVFAGVITTTRPRTSALG